MIADVQIILPVICLRNGLERRAVLLQQLQLAARRQAQEAVSVAQQDLRRVAAGQGLPMAGAVGSDRSRV